MVIAFRRRPCALRRHPACYCLPIGCFSAPEPAQSALSTGCLFRRRRRRPIAPEGGLRKKLGSACRASVSRRRRFLPGGNGRGGCLQGRAGHVRQSFVRPAPSRRAPGSNWDDWRTAWDVRHATSRRHLAKLRGSGPKFYEVRQVQGRGRDVLACAPATLRRCFYAIYGPLRLCAAAWDFTPCRSTWGIRP